MCNQNHISNIPLRILYTMLRVADLERSVTFYRDVLGMQELRRENFTAGRFTLVFMGYGENQAMVELTYNWDQNDYELGTAYGHIALAVNDMHAICKQFRQANVKIVREPGPMTYPVDETGHREVIAFIEDPDGYQIELIETPAA